MPLSPEQQKVYSKQYYDKNKEQYQARNRARRSLLKKIVVEIKSFTPCADCDNQYPHYVMQFDHLPGLPKKADISDIGMFGSVQALLDEMDKCDVVCGNCHAERTWNRSNEVAA